METKIAILRGINVGGNRKILMADLKKMFQDLGHTHIVTYIQSGNVVFKSSVENAKLTSSLESAIKTKFGHDVPVIIRTSRELEKAVLNNSFYHPDADVTKLHLTFLNEQPALKQIADIETFDQEPDKFMIVGKEVFIFCEGKYHQSKLTNAFFEKKLKVGATTRNWKTVLKLLELSKGL